MGTLWPAARQRVRRLRWLAAAAGPRSGRRARDLPGPDRHQRRHGGDGHRESRHGRAGCQPGPPRHPHVGLRREHVEPDDARPAQGGRGQDDALPGRLVRRPLSLGDAHGDVDTRRGRRGQRPLHRARRRLRRLRRHPRKSGRQRGDHRELRHEPPGDRPGRAAGGGRLGRLRERRSRQHHRDRPRQHRPRLADGRLLGEPARGGARCRPTTATTSCASATRPRSA